jgi:hypothetical protein
LNSPRPSFSCISLPPFPKSFNRSYFSLYIHVYMVFVPYSPSYTLSPHTPPSHWYQSPERTCFALLKLEFWTQSFTLARQTLYCLSHTSSITLILKDFWNLLTVTKVFSLPYWVATWFPIPHLSKVHKTFSPTGHKQWIYIAESLQFWCFKEPGCDSPQTLTVNSIPSLLQWQTFKISLVLSPKYVFLPIII